MDLYAAFLGGPIAEGRMGEDHEIVFVVASSPEEAKASSKAKWSGVGRCHVDAVQRVDIVDGHRVSLTRVAPESPDRTKIRSYN
jgi:hypothetical protein